MKFSLFLVAEMSLFFTTQISAGEPVPIVKLIKTGIQLYGDSKKLTVEPEETDLQKAGRLATPVMPSRAQLQVMHDKQEKIAACHAEHDIVIMGKTFSALGCEGEDK